MGKDRKFFWHEPTNGRRPKTFKANNKQSVDHNADQRGISRYASTVGLGSYSMARKRHSGEHHPLVANRPDGRLAGHNLKKEGFGKHSYINVPFKAPNEFPEKNYIVLKKQEDFELRLYWMPDRKKWLFVKREGRSILRSITYSSKATALLYYTRFRITWFELAAQPPST